MRGKNLVILGVAAVAIIMACTHSTPAFIKFDRNQGRLIQKYSTSDYKGARAALHAMLKRIDKIATRPIHGVDLDNERWPVEGRLALMYEHAGDFEKANHYLNAAVSHYNSTNAHKIDTKGMREMILRLESKTMPKWRWGDQSETAPSEAHL